jgi:hypothetical protein
MRTLRSWGPTPSKDPNNNPQFDDWLMNMPGFKAISGDSSGRWIKQMTQYRRPGSIRDTVNKHSVPYSDSSIIAWTAGFDLDFPFRSSYITGSKVIKD